MNKTVRLIQEITSEQVASIDTLKGKQLHLTLDEVTSLGSVIVDYQELISKFMEENMAKSINIKLKRHLIYRGITVVVVIISIDSTYIN